MKKEIWMPVTGFEDYYEISTHGRVKGLEREVWGGKSYYTKPELIMKPGIAHGRKNVCFRVNGNPAMKQVNRLVYEHFVGDIGDKQIGYKDGNTLNNYYENLELLDYNYILNTKNRITMKVHEFEDEMRAYWMELLEKGYTKEQIMEMTDVLYEKLPFMKKVK